jgi:hypothetical protein
VAGQHEAAAAGIRLGAPACTSNLEAATGRGVIICFFHLQAAAKLEKKTPGHPADFVKMGLRHNFKGLVHPA